MSDEQLLPASSVTMAAAVATDANMEGHGAAGRRVSARRASGPGPGPGAGTNGRAEIAALADELLPALIARLSASSLGELEVTEGSWRVRLRRAPATSEPVEEEASVGRGRGSRTGHGTPAAMDGVDGAGAGASTAGRTQSAAATHRETSRLIATSPAVGYFAPRDGAGVGQTVRSGDVLGHIDVLGVRQEVVSAHDGIVSRLLAAAGEAVEYGQELVRIERVAKGSRVGGPTDGAAGPTHDVPPTGATPATASSPMQGSDETSPAVARPTEPAPDANATLVIATRATPDVAAR